MMDLFFTHFGLTEAAIDSYRQNITDYFSTDELVEYSRFKVLRRQNEWISSRIISKLMISRILNNRLLRFQDIRIQKEMSGQPFICIDGQGRLEGRFSLSHSHGFVFCGYSPISPMNFGFDLEIIEGRSPEFINDYFTPTEIDLYRRSDPDIQQDTATLIWSAKEATLKAVGKGLSIDTRNVEVIPREINSKFEGWNIWDVSFLEISEKKYKVIWMKIGGFIRTISFSAEYQVRLNEINLE